MRKLILSSIIVLITSAILISCRKMPCSPANSRIALVSFSPTESDTVIIRRYARNGDFTSLKDTFLFTGPSGNYFHDTLFLNNLIDQYNPIVSTWDYEVVLPIANKVFRINDIIEKVWSMSPGLGKVNCINPITSYKVNGQLVSGANDYTIIFLKK